MHSLLANFGAPTTLPLASAWEWFQPPSSTGAQQVDSLFWFITWVCVFFFVLIVGLMARFMVIYRARPGYQAEESPHHNNTLEAAWSIIPLLIVVVIFFFGFTGFLDMRNAPADAYVINVEAKKWNWAFKYPNGHIDSNLHVPIDTPVKLVMSSSDVLHSLYIPAFRVKMDCVPGKYTSLWFRATQATQDDNEDGVKAFVGDPGQAAEPPEADFDLFCTEYCGTGHSSMYSKVVVHESGGFEKWMAKAVDITKDPPAVAGENLYKRRGCSQCHTVTGVDQPGNGGPSFKGYYGKVVEWTNGESGEVDENYIRESILNPMAKIRKGYRPIMPTYQGQLNDDQIYAIIQYIKSVNDLVPTDWPKPAEEEGEPGEEGAENTAEPEVEEPAAEDEPEEEPAAADAA